MALRKTQNLALKLDTRDDNELAFTADTDVTEIADPAPAVSAAPEPAPRPVFQAAPAQPLPEGFTVIPASRADRGRGDQRQGDRRQGDRRAMDQLRTEALRNIISNVDARAMGNGRAGKRMSINGSRIPASRLILLAVALLAGGFAAFLAIHHDEPAPVPATPVEAVKPAPATQILVAKSNIGVGQRLTGSMLEWQDWPEATLRPDYITIASMPDAMTDMAKSVARGEFFPGEPIRAQKLTDAGHGFLSTLLDSGKRGVSVPISADSASGGFIVPNDHVDVVLTRSSSGGQMSETILTNVRILAINTNLGGNGASAEDGKSDGTADPAAQAFAGSATATLELNPPQAETIINSTSLGKLSLMLRPTEDNEDPGAAAERTANAAIRLTSPFWAGGTATQAPAPAAVVPQ